MSKFSSWRRVAAVMSVAALVAACGGGDDDAPADDAAAETETDTEDGADDVEEAGDAGDDAAASDVCAPNDAVMSSITVGINNPNYATQVPVILARDRGYFEEVGITEIEVLETDDYIAGLLGGSLQITQGDTDVAFGSAEASGEDITYLGTYRGNEYQILAVGPDIESAEDLVGADLTGGALGSRNQLLVERIVEELGIDSDDVNFVPQGGNSDATLQAIISGTVDGGALFPRHRFALEEAGGQFLYEQFEELPQEGILAMGDFVEENRETVHAYLCATLRARQDMYDAVGDEAAASAIIDEMREAGFEIPVEFEGVFDLEVEQITRDGGFDPARMDALVEEQIMLENLPEGIDWRQFVDVEPINEVQEALGLDVNPASLD
jgi:ABC-type nitrate/sulfonate/bicarbonate transport system substrate-binding protein